ncbi:unnamed protein product [Parascedosporium putredinis]|uniref:alpha-1,2-Mannosidase n=1 Tax=Parascedosporium putredinis TaxID=1442378 RepID=A0A9P1MCT8_9PEZI|nr:unnamed protein product [Parascedosporium putredinis]CAI8002252.1 unnamed protein product [Parascedosporium putredinis]
MASRHLTFCLIALVLGPWLSMAMGPGYMQQLRQETVRMFRHGFDNYMEHAFPEDELRPVTCAPLTRDRENPANIGLNDVLGNYSLTLIDSLSTLAILAGGPEEDPYTGRPALEDFQSGVSEIVKLYGDGRRGFSGHGARSKGFDLDSKVQVFETVIRGVGGLLSAHLFANGDLPIPGYEPAPPPAGATPIRLLPAFYTNTGIPYPRVNLRDGIPFTQTPLNYQSAAARGTYGRDITETCSAGAGTLVLEFTVLSRLSGDPRFEEVAKRAFWAIWEERSPLDLIGGGIDAERATWISTASGIGAGIDSFFEYAMKAHILLSGLDTPNETAVSFTRRNEYKPHWQNPNDDFHHPSYMNGNYQTGAVASLWIDSLSAFYPGLLTLAGELEEAVEAHLLYAALWTRFRALPERWSLRDGQVESNLGWWPGRPEFIESTYHLYRATQDPWYLYVGEMVLKDVTARCRTDCGWAGLQDVRTGEKSDRMESFFLGETTKYLYLLFDPDHVLNKLDAPFVFSTEGHPLLIPREKTGSSRSSAGPVAARTDLYHAAGITGLHATPNIHGEVEHPVLKMPDEGLFIASLDDLKLQMVLETDSYGLSSIWRIVSVNNVPLGRDESAIIDADIISDMTDPLFHRVRDQSAAVKGGPNSFVSAYKAAMRTVKDRVSLVFPRFQATRTPVPEVGRASAAAAAAAAAAAFRDDNEDEDMYDLGLDLDVDLDNLDLVHESIDSFFAATPVGKGAQLVPDAPLAKYVSSADPESEIHLPWTSIYMTDQACEPLPLDAPRSHQVIVVRRGACTFSEKLSSIPNFYPSASSLALVVVVDDEGDPSEDGLVSPNLEHMQFTSSGLPRYNPIPLVLVRTPPGGYEKFAEATSIGIRRLYHVQSRGTRIANLRVR